MKHLIIIFLFLSINLFAIVEGDRPSDSQIYKFSVFGSVEVTGNTMMEASPPGNVNDILLSNSDGDLASIPYDAEIEKVLLFWTGSLGTTAFVPDSDVRFRYTDSVTRIVQADRCRTVNSMEGFFYCKADITTEFKNHDGSFHYNGRYNLSGLNADPGDCVEDPYICQAKYAAWSMVVVYKSPTARVKRDIVIYDSFLHLDEREDSIGIDQFVISGFKAQSPVVGEFTYFGLEGDRFLGVPPQDRDPNYPCATCYDFISLDNQKLHDDLNLPNNIWNSSLALGVDIDTFNIGETGLDILSPGQQSVTVKLGSGDGIIPNAIPEAGGGESVFLGYIILALDTLSPNFRTDATNLSVDRTEASQGDILTYFLTVTNEGSLVANNVKVLDAIPDYVDYIPGSTMVDGVVVNDSINTPSGLNIGNIDFRGDNNKIVRFQVRVRSNVANGTEIFNKVKIISDELLTEPTYTNRVRTLINAPELTTPILTVRDENGANHIPGDWFEYSVRINNTQNNPISNILYKNTLPSDFVEVQVISLPVNAVDSSNGLVIDISNIEVPALSSIILKYRVRLKTITEFINSGVTEDQINNRVVSSQGYITTPAIPNNILTDNDVGGSQHDPTTFRITKEVNANFSTSTKEVENLNGTTNFKPGDTIKYTITAKNSSTDRVTGISVVDNIDERYLENIVITAGVGSYNGDRINWVISELGANSSMVLSFTAKIKSPLLNGTVIANQASISITGRSDLTDDPNTPAVDDATKITIISESNFVTSTKSYIDENGGSSVQPGELVTYVVTLKNSGDGVGENLVVTDTISEDLTVVEVLDGGVYDNVTRVVRWSYETNPNLAKVATDINLRVRVRVNSDLNDGDIVSNQASIDSSDSMVQYLTDNPNTPAISDPTTFEVYRRAELSESYKIYEDINGGFIEAGDTIRYTIQVRNTGLLSTTNVIVADVIDSNLEDITLETPGGVFENGTITWQGGALSTVDFNSTVELKFTAKIKDDVSHGTVIENQALIRSDQFLFILTDDPNTQELDDPTKFTVTSFPELTFTKEYEDLNGGDLEVRDRIKYTITVSNSNKTDTNALKIEDIIPTELENITTSGVISEGKIVWNTQPLNRGESITLTFEGDLKIVPDQTEVCNQATLSDESLGLNMVSDNPLTQDVDDSTCYSVISNLEISEFEKTFEDLNGGEIRPDDIIKYTIRFKNTGNIPITNIEIKDVVSENLTDITVENGILEDNTITWSAENTPDLANIEPNDEKILTFTAKIVKPLANGTTISNQASLKIEEYTLLSDDPTTDEVADPTKFNIVSEAHIVFTKDVRNLNGSNIFMPKDEVIYILKVENDGDDFANNLVVTDEISEFLYDINVDTGNIVDRTITWNSTTNPELVKLDNTPLVLTIRAKIAKDVENDTEVSNQGVVVGDNIETINSDDPNTDEELDPTKFIVKVPHVKVEKSVDKREYFAGEEFDYTIKLTNDSEVVARELRFVDSLDENLEYVSVSNPGCIRFSLGVVCSHRSISDLLELEPNESFEVKIRVKVKEDVAVDTVIENQATFYDDYLTKSSLSDDPNTDEELDSTKIVVKFNSDFTFEKRVLDTPYIGGFFSYELKVTNNSSQNVNGLSISDTLPEELEFSEATGDISCSATDGLLECPTFSLAPNSSKVINLKVRIKYTVSENQEIFNQAILKLPSTICSTPAECALLSDDPITIESHDPTKIIALLPPDVTFTKTTPKTKYLAGEEVEYTIKVQNNTWGIIENLVITDGIDINFVQSVELDKPCDILESNPIQIRCSSQNIPELEHFAGGTSFELKIKVKTKEDLEVGTKLYNQGVLTADNLDEDILSDDSNTPNLNDKTVITIEGVPVVTATKEVFDDNSDGVYNPNELISYKIKVKNNSQDGTLSNFIIKDKFPIDKLTLMENDSRYLIDSDTGVITLSYQTIPELREIAAGEQVEFTIFAKTKDDLVNNEIVTNQAEVLYFGITEPILTDDPTTEEINDPTRFTIESVANLMNFYKEVTDLDGNDYFPGDKVKYVLRVKNLGVIAAENVIISDIIDTTNLEIISAENGRIEENKVTFHYEDNDNLLLVEPNQEILFTIVAKIKGDVRDNTTVSNQAFIQASNITRTEPSDDPNTDISNDSTKFKVNSSSILVVEKVAIDLAGNGYKAGDSVRYVITVKNEGISSSFDTMVTDSIPENTEYILNSTKVDDSSVSDTEDGLAPFLNGLNIGDISAGDFKILSFEVKILSSTPEGVIISNQAIVTNNTNVTKPSDDPNTTVKDDATKFAVGDLPILSQFTKKATVIDENEDGVANIGELIEYEINIVAASSETLKAFTFSDIIPENVTYIEESFSTNLNSDDYTLTYNENSHKLEIITTELNWESGVNISFKVKIDSGIKVINQANAIYPVANGVNYLSDDPDTEIENDPTVVFVGDIKKADLVISKEVKDLNGGVVFPKDSLEYSIKIENKGNKVAKDIKLVDIIPSHVEFIRNSESLTDSAAHFLFEPTFGENGRVVVTNITVEPGTTFELKFNVKIFEDANDGDIITNLATINYDDEDKESNEVTTIVGSISGTSYLIGNLKYLTRESQKEPLEDYKIRLFRVKDGRAILENESKTDELGNFKVINLPIGNYIVKYYNQNDVLFGSEEVGFLIPEISQRKELLFKPKGRIYNTQKEKIVPFVRVYLYKAESGKSISGSDCRDKDLIDLPQGQQGQLTDKYGFYQFDLPKDKDLEKVSICVDAAPHYNFPSSLFEPEDGSFDPNIVEESGFLPVGRYYLDFFVEDFDKVIYNDISIDDIKTKIKISKIVEQKEAKSGSIVTYRVTIKNESNISFEGENRVKIEDIMPKYLQLIKKSFKIYRFTNGINRGAIEGLSEPDLLGKHIIFGDFDLKAGEKVELTYRVAVSTNAKPGIYENFAQLLNSDNQVLSNRASAKVKIIYDSDMDLGSIIGKVYCDDNSNGIQDLAEYGLEGVALYNDAGFSSVTDKHGKYHFSILKPGIHMVKVDKNSFLPGINVLEESRIINITHGLVERVNFGVDCKFVNKVEKLKEKKQFKKRDILYEKIVSVVGNLYNELLIGDKKIYIKRFNLEKSKDFFMADEDIDLWVKENPTQLVNYYIYRYNKREFTDKTILDDSSLARFEQIRDAKHLKFKLKPGQYISYAEIVDGKDTYTTKPMVLNIQVPPNKDGKQLLKFKNIKFVFNEIATINGDLLNTNKGKIFKLYNKKELDKFNFAFTDKDGYKANLLIENGKKKDINILTLDYYGDKLLFGKKDYSIKIKIDTKKITKETDKASMTIQILDIVGKDKKVITKDDTLTIKYSNYDNMKNDMKKLYSSDIKFGEKNTPLVNIAEINIIDKTTNIPLNIETPKMVKEYKKILFEFDKNHIIKDLKLNFVKDNGSYKTLTENKIVDNKFRVDTKKGSYGYLQYQIIPESYYKDLNLKYVDKIFYFSSKLDLTPTLKKSKRRKGKRNKKVISTVSNQKKISKVLINGKEIKKGENDIELSNKYLTVELLYNDNSTLQLLLNFNRDSSLLVTKKAEKGEHKVTPVHVDKDVEISKKGGDKIEKGENMAEKGEHKVTPVHVEKDVDIAKNESHKTLDSILSLNDKKEIDYNNFNYKDDINKVLKVAKIKSLDSELHTFRISLPKDGAVIKADNIYLKGWQPKGSTVFVNNKKTEPSDIGYFSIQIPVNSETKKIDIKVIDKNGNIGTISRGIKTTDYRYFLMAFAQSSIGYEPARVEDNNYVTFADEQLYLQGRGVVFFKGQIKGKTLKKYLKEYLKYDKIKEIKAMIHLDTGKDSDFEQYITNLINPERFYPIYGDSSKETQEVKSRGKLYIKIDIDRSKIVWGNFKTKIHNSELVRYDKILSGLLLDFNKKIGDFDTKATLFYSGDELASKSLYNEFVGTGGSVYYLQSTFIEEGTERVKIIIRDRDTGLELYQKTLVLNQDYTVNYATGSLILKEPLPSSVETSFLTAGKLDDNSLIGHPVYLSVSYQSNSIADITGKSSIGLSVKERFKKKYYLTAHYIRENKSFQGDDSDYSIGGMGVGYEHTKNTKIFMEFAGSSNFDNMTYYSENGGITFKQGRTEEGEADFYKDKDTSGFAFKLKGTLAGKDFSKDDILKTVKLNAVYQYMGANFYSIGNRANPNMDMGGHKISFLAQGKLSKKQNLKLSYSGVMSDIYGDLDDAENKINKQLVTLRYDHKLNDKISFGIEHQAGYISETREGYKYTELELMDKSSVTNVTSFLYRHKISKDFRITFGQDIIEGYDARMKDFSLGDRFQSNLTAEYDITKKISLIGTESVRFSGDNSTTLGAKYKLDDKSSLYLNQRFIDTTAFRSSTVIGGSNSVGKDGKLYGEYQLDSGTTDEHSRALLGIGKTFKINKDFNISAGAEHTYYKDFNGKIRYRDALSFGMKYKIKDVMNLFTKHELRYDKFDTPRLHYYALNGGQYKYSEDITFLSRINYFVTRNMELGSNEVEMGEASFGFALRPYTFDMINVLGKYSLITQMRPLSLSNSSIFRETAHVLSLTGIYEFPFKLQLSQKGVMKYSVNLESDTIDSSLITLMSLTRLSYHLLKKFDISAEYRIRAMLDYDWTQGVLLEGAYNIKEYFYLGAGYNFTSFTDNMYYMNSNDAGGFFIRVMGRW